MTAAVTAALLELHLPATSLSAKDAPRTAIVAARNLCRAKRFREALHLLRAGPSAWADRPEAAGPLVHALLSVGRADELLVEMQRLRSLRGSDDPHVQRLLAALRTPATASRLTDVAAAHDSLWGAFLPDLGAKLSSLSDLDPRGAAISESLVENLHALRSDGMDPAEFRRRLAFGWFAVGYLAFLRRAREVPDPPDAPGRRLALRRLAGQIPQIVTLQGTDPLASAEGRSVVLALSHTGVVALASLAGRISNLPRSIVALRTQVDERSLNVATGDPDATRQFLRLAQALRTERRIVTIVPDGGAGDTHAVEVLGRPVPVGKGAATLAFRGRAATFAARSRWTGRGFEVQILPGPVAEDDRGPFEEAFYRFYADHLEQILLGPPEDMGPVAGVFDTFAKRRRTPP